MTDETKTKVTVNCPDIVNRYNKSIGGVDLHDQLLFLYRFSFKPKKFYHRLAFHLFGVTLVNSLILYKRVCQFLSLPKNKINKLSEIKSRVANALMHKGKIVETRKRGRPSFASPEPSW